MKLLKNRGDIYLSKSGYKSSKESRVLLILLCVIVVFTAAFLVLLSRQYNSAAEFFADGEQLTTQSEEAAEEMLPAMEGKTNFLVMETDDAQTTIHYLFLLQADRDSGAYKVTSLSPSTKIDSESLFDIYSLGGGAALQTRLTEYFGFEIDYFAQFQVSSFVEFAGKLGTFIYPATEQIRFSGGTGDDKYTLRVNEGEQQMNGKELSNLLRYFSCESKNYAMENEAVLYAVTELFNEKNYEDCEPLFRLFIQSCSTNITVRDFENGKDALMVFCKKNKDITVYSAAAEYEENVLTPSAVKQIKGYFSQS